MENTAASSGPELVKQRAERKLTLQTQVLGAVTKVFKAVFSRQATSAEAHIPTSAGKVVAQQVDASTITITIKL